MRSVRGRLKDFRWKILVALFVICKITNGQINIPEDSISPIKIFSVNPRIYKSHDTIWVYSGVCKTLKTTIFTGQRALSLPGGASATKAPLFTVHGNIQYDFLYRSFADTPFYQKDFQQHTVQTSFTVTVNDKYPLHVNLALRKSNSPFFKDFLDGGVVFDGLSYNQNLRQQLMTKIPKQIQGRSYLAAAESLLEKELKKYNALKRRLNSVDISQKLIEERERIYYQSLKLRTPGLPGKDDLGIDTLTSGVMEKLKKRAKEFDTDTVESFVKKVEEKRKELDSLQDRISKLQTQVDSMKDKMAGDISIAKQKILQARSSKEISKLLSEYGLEEKRTMSDKIIGNFKTVGVGRSILNYSELTVKNVSLTGVNLEYNPRLYFAVAAGKIDYGFRDFFGRNINQKNQNLAMGRFGFGDKDRKAIILSVFTGKKNNYEHAVRDTLPDHINVAGYSVEGIFKINEHTFFSGEVAKTTKPITGPFGNNNNLKNLVDFSDNSNLGISAKGETFLPQTDTRLSGFVRKTGESFQSFSLFTYNTDQTSWLLRFDQPFLKRKVGVTAMLRRNDFVNPFVQQTFKTSTVFKSFQVNVRIPKWPVFSAGYYPGSQIYIVDKIRAYQNAYYILNGSVIHSYSAAGIRMLSSLIYNKYSSKATDSGFISYKGINYIASQTLMLGKLQLQGQYIYTDQEQMKFHTLDGDADYSFSSLVQAGAGVKYNKVLSGGTYWGSRASLRLEFKQLGMLQMQYEKSYLPTIQRTLFPVEMGRLTWFKTF